MRIRDDFLVWKRQLVLLRSYLNEDSGAGSKGVGGIKGSHDHAGTVIKLKFFEPSQQPINNSFKQSRLF